jgi:hypothetical protein
MLFCVLLPQCKKPTPTLNIILYNQSLPVIQKYVSGTWKLEYTYGGIMINLHTDFHNKDYIWQIDDGIRIKQSFMGNPTADTLIDWYQINIGADTTFVLRFYDNRLYPYNYIVWGIADDSLELKDYSSDPVTYLFSKHD